MPDSSSPLVAGRQRWCFLFAHPGHELRVHHLLGLMRPTVAIVTDGSGSTGESRLHHSAAIVAAAQATPAPIFGTLRDTDAYAALLAGDLAPFVALRERVATLLRAEGIQAVLIDAAEGYNPVHDVCHWLGRAAVLQARESGAAIECFEVDLVSHPDGSGDGLRIHLDDRAFAQKLQAVIGYDVLAHEAVAAFQHYGEDAFRVEFLRRVNGAAVPPATWVPHYEVVGEARVKSGRYSSVLRYAQHVRPVIEALVAAPVHAATLSSLHQ
jgi:hypothetical protein